MRKWAFNKALLEVTRPNLQEPIDFLNEFVLEASRRHKANKSDNNKNMCSSNNSNRSIVILITTIIIVLIIVIHLTFWSR